MTVYSACYWFKTNDEEIQLAYLACNFVPNIFVYHWWGNGRDFGIHWLDWIYLLFPYHGNDLSWAHGKGKVFGSFIFLTPGPKLHLMAFWVDLCHSCCSGRILSSLMFYYKLSISGYTVFLTWTKICIRHCAYILMRWI